MVVGSEVEFGLDGLDHVDDLAEIDEHVAQLRLGAGAQPVAAAALPPPEGEAVDGRDVGDDGPVARRGGEFFDRDEAVSVDGSAQAANRDAFLVVRGQIDPMLLFCGRQLRDCTMVSP